VAFEQNETVNGHRSRLQQAVAFDKRMYAVWMSGKEPGESDMGQELTEFGQLSTPYHRRFDFALEMIKVVRWVRPCPQHPGLAALAECAQPAELEIKGRDVNALQCTINISSGVAVDFTNESQSQMKVFGINPAGVWKAFANAGEMLTEGLRQRETGKQTQHGGRSLSSEGRYRHAL
jgi:hypothetical protein